MTDPAPSMAPSEVRIDDLNHVFGRLRARTLDYCDQTLAENVTPAALDLFKAHLKSIMGISQEECRALLRGDYVPPGGRHAWRNRR